MSIIWATIILVLSLHVTSSFDDVDFDPFDCYRDLCTSRRQFCSHSEQRCKECQHAHCLDPKTVPLQCSPLCAEWESRSTKGQTTRVITTLRTLSSGGYSPTTSNEDRNDFMHTGTETREKGSVYSPRVLYAVVSGLVVVVVVLLALFTTSLACLYRLHRRRCRHPASSYPGMEGRGEEGVTEEDEKGEEQVLLEGGERCGSKSGTTGWTSSTLPSRLGGTTMPRSSWHHQTKQESKSVQTDPILQPHLNPAGSADQPSLSERRNAVVQPAGDSPASTSTGHFKDCGQLPDPDHAEDGNDDGALPPPPPPPRRPAYPASLRHVVEADPGQSLTRQNVKESCPKSL